MAPSRRILILGAGELGGAVIDSLLSHPAYDKTTTSLAVAIRPKTLESIVGASLSSDIPISPQQKYLSDLHTEHKVALVSADLSTSSISELAQLFTPYTTIIHAGGMTLPSGTQLKVTRAVLAAHCAEYIPWQWGVDYDAIGSTGGLGLFAEQCEVRDLLRSQQKSGSTSEGTKWLIVSCGVFMSFLFEEFWGVVVRDEADTNRDVNAEKKTTGIRALGGWDHGITATTARDIARCNAELVLSDTHLRDRAVYIAGDTMPYHEFADLVQRVTRTEVTREVWTTEWLKEQAAQATNEEEQKLWKYRVVFSEDVGLSWPKEKTYNDTKGLEMEGIEQWIRVNGLQ